MKKLKVLLLALILIPLFASAKEIVLQNGLDGYSGCQDTWILRYTKEGLVMQEYMPDRFDVYADTCLSWMGGMVYTGRALIQFDLSQINDVTVNSAFLCMYPYDCFDMNAMWDYNMRNGPKKVYKVTKKWDEATANWKNPWAVEGGDFDESNPLSSSSQKDTTVGEWERFDVTEVVQQHVQNPATNFGFLIKFDDNDRRGIMVYSAQNEKTDMRPKLVINGDNTKIVSTKDVSVNTGLHLSVRGSSVWLHVPAGIEAGKVTLYTVDGRVTAALTVDEYKRDFQLSQQTTSGTYFMKYESNNKTVIKKSVLIR